MSVSANKKYTCNGILLHMAGFAKVSFSFNSCISALLCSLHSTLNQILEALQPLQKLLELLNPRFDSVLRHTFEQGRLSRVTPASVPTISFSAARVGPAGGYLNAAGTAGNLLLHGTSGKEANQYLKSMPGLSKGLRRARDEHGGQSSTDSITSATRKKLELEYWHTLLHCRPAYLD